MKKAIKRDDLVVTVEFDEDCEHVTVNGAGQAVQWDPYSGFSDPLCEVLQEFEREVVLATLTEFCRGAKKLQAA